MGAAGGGTIIQVNQVSTTNERDVAVGSVVKAIYLELWLVGAANAQLSSMTVIVEKVPAGQSSATAANMAALNSYDNKKNILEIHQGLLGQDSTNPVPFFRHWIKIPKGKQRFGLGDVVKFTINAISEDTTFCGVSIYKVYN